MGISWPAKLEGNTVRLPLTEAGLQRIEAPNAEKREEIERLIDRVGEEVAKIYLKVCNVIQEDAVMRFGIALANFSSRQSLIT